MSHVLRSITEKNSESEQSGQMIILTSKVFLKFQLFCIVRNFLKDSRIYILIYAENITVRIKKKLKTCCLWGKKMETRGW